VREATIERLEREFRALLQAIDEVPKERLLEPRTVGDWSVRDLLTHIATWENEFLKALPVILEGKRLTHYSTVYGGVSAFNAAQQDRTKALSLTDARQYLAKTHALVLATLVDLPPLPPKVEERMRRRLRQDATNHYREHAEQVSAWSKQEHSTGD